MLSQMIDLNSNVQQLSDDLWIVKNKLNKFAMYNLKREQLTHFSYDEIEEIKGIPNFYFVTVYDKDNGIMGVIDKNGKMVIPLQDDWASVIHEAFVRFYTPIT